MKVIVAGSRFGFSGEEVLDAIVDSGFIVDRLVCGMADGVDLIGYALALLAGATKEDVDEFPADWYNLGKSAGIVRNAQMGKYADAAIVLICNDSSGSTNMVEYMTKHNKPVYVVRKYDDAIKKRNRKAAKPKQPTNVPNSLFQMVGNALNR